jgi:hypothetical protein
MVVPSSRRETSDESLGFNDKSIRQFCHQRATQLSHRGTLKSLWILTITLPFARRVAAAEVIGRGSGPVESNQRFYMRRAAEERTAAHRAITPQAREWHAKLAQDFAQRAIESGAVTATA